MFLRGNMIIVEKYGGSSVANIELIKKIAERIKKKCLEGNEIVVVVSAMGKTTNKLIALASEISKEPNLRDLDALLSVGEKITASLLSIALNDIGVKAISLSGWQAEIRTDNQFGKAKIKSIGNEIGNKLKEGYVVCVAGFQGVDDMNNITTLGRGGSDTTAVAISACLGVDCNIYTDVEYISTVDPKKIPQARKIETIGYNQMLEMSVNGAKVLEPRCVELAKKTGTKIYLARSLEKDKKGTTVMQKNIEGAYIEGIACRENIGLLRMESKDFFRILEDKSKHIPSFEFFNQIKIKNKRYISLMCDKEIIKKLIENEEKYFYEDSLAKITIIGFGFSVHPSIVKKIYKILGNEIIDLNLSETTISIIVKKEVLNNLVEKLVVEFEL